MTGDQAALAHQSSRSIQRTNRAILWLAVAAAFLTLVASIGIMTWNALSVRHQVGDLKDQITISHNDNIARLKTISCLTATLDQILIELAASQQALLHHQPAPAFTIPKPC